VEVQLHTFYTLELQVSEKSGTNKNFIFIYRLKLTVKKLKMALTLDARVEMVLLCGRQGCSQRKVAD
jgi:hypothetical protein